MSNQPAERAAEFHALVERHAAYERSVRLIGWSPHAEARETHAARAARLAELTELLNTTQSAHYDPAEAVDRWIETHPLAMTGTGMKRVIDKSSNGGNGTTVGLQIGDPQKGGRWYPLHEGMFATGNGTLVLTLPDSVAEEFRQQGRRSLRREFQSLMNP